MTILYGIAVLSSLLFSYCVFIFCCFIFLLIPKPTEDFFLLDQLHKPTTPVTSALMAKIKFGPRKKLENLLGIKKSLRKHPKSPSGVWILLVLLSKIYFYVPHVIKEQQMLGVLCKINQPQTQGLNSPLTRAHHCLKSTLFTGNSAASFLSFTSGSFAEI